MFGALPFGSFPYGSAPLYSAPTAAAFQRMAILSPRDFDAATLTASSEVATLPVANLQDQRPRKVWRTLGTEEYVYVTFAAPIAANMLGLRHTLSAAGVFRVWLADTIANTVAAPAVDTGWQSVWPPTGRPSLPEWTSYLSALTWTNDALYRCARIGLANSGSTAGHMDICRLALARYWQPSINFDFGATVMARTPKDIQAETDFGGIFTDRRGGRAGRSMRLSISALNKQEVLDGFDELASLRGLWGDVFAFLDLAGGANFQKSSLHGVFAVPSEHQAVSAFGDGGDMLTVGSINVRELI